MVSSGKATGKGFKGKKGNPPKFQIMRQALPSEGQEVEEARREQVRQSHIFFKNIFEC